MRFLILTLGLTVSCAPPTVERSSGSANASRCTESAQCRAQEECAQGLCVPMENHRDSECFSASDCDQGERCYRGSCIAEDNNDACRSDNDCRRSEVCTNGACVPEQSGCQGNSDCPNGQTCNDGRCITTQGANNDCRADRDCPNGQACRSGRCVTQQSGGARCQTHQECAAGQACSQPQGVCEPWLGARCQGDNDCALRDSQGVSTPGMCHQGQCRVAQFGDCQDDNDCGGSYSCITAGRYQMCLQGCQDSSVCDSNLKCDQDISACWYNMCGQPQELSERYQQINNGQLGGRCNADGRDDGTCVEVSAGENQWVGICIEGGNARVGDACLFDAHRDDDDNQCEGGALCHFDNDRNRGKCVASCSTEHGSVRCSGNTTCMLGRCLSRAQQCDPGSPDACGSMGRCSLMNWGEDAGMCNLQETNPRPAGERCDKSTQCVDGTLCLTLNRGTAPSTCHALCRPRGGGQTCPTSTRCTSLSELSGGQITGNWGLCAPTSN